ncbi:MAG: MFS transporter [Candidatus Bathyarchaeia archaeon]
MAYVTYALLYLARLNFSIALPLLSVELGLSKFTLGLIAGVFSISYAIGQFIHGRLVDRYGPKKIILIGLIVSGIMNILFSRINTLILLIVVWAVNGYAQSTGWPAVVKLVSSRFKSELGKIGGLFGSCFLVGNMVAWPILGYLVSNYGWRMVFTIPSIILIVLAVLFYLTVEEVEKTEAYNSKQIVNFKKLIFSKGLATMTSVYILLQFVRSVFTLWAPSYLFEKYRLPLDVAGYTAAVIPLGGIVGSLVSGWLSDYLEKSGRKLTICVLTISLGFAIAAFHYASNIGLEVGVLSLFIVGFTLYGPHVIISTVIPMELDESYGGASVAGFIDGMGYFGSMLAESSTGWLIEAHGWSGAVTFCLTSTLLATILVAFLYEKKK